MRLDVTSKETSASGGLLQRYLSTVPAHHIDSGAAAFYAGLDTIGAVAPSVADSIVRELADQRSNVKLIASENYCSLAVQLAQGNLLTDKYAEGIHGHRFYAGCDNVDAIEREAADLARKLFGADNAYVQAHSGADANLVASYRSWRRQWSHRSWSNWVRRTQQTGRRGLGEVAAGICRPADAGMDYYSGGHLTHGTATTSRAGSSRRIRTRSTGTQVFSTWMPSDGRPTRCVPGSCSPGYSAYSRKINFAKFREVADEVGATFMVDMRTSQAWLRARCSPATTTRCRTRTS